jgi:hypothetical protein
MLESTPSLIVPQSGFVQQIIDISDRIEPTKSSQTSLGRILESIFHLKHVFGTNKLWNNIENYNLTAENIKPKSYFF